MKKIAFALIVVLLFGIKTIKAQEQELSASEPISSGCLSHSRGAEIATSPTIKLTKEENILSVELLNYTSNCGTTGFEVENKIIDGNNENPTVAINVTPVIPAYMDCTCPFNISYTVRDLEKNNFYLTCWWYEGQVELTEGEPLVLEYQTKDVVIDGLKFRLLKVSHQAKLIYQNTWDNNVTTLQIPSEVEYEGEKYTVTSVNQSVFSKNSRITKIIIPKTVKNTDFGSNEGFKYNPFVDCFSVESIEVEEGNPAICSVDGVLFNKDTTTLIGYPAGATRELYTVPASVKTAGDGAFFNSKYLKKIVLPDNIETLGYSLFASSKSLEEVTLPSSIKELSIYLFKDCTKLKSVVIPEGVTTIGYSAFEGCSRLESISLPESINFIDFFAFGSLSNLKNVYCQAKIVPNTSQNVFGNVNLSKVTLHVPAASISAYQATEPWKNFKEIVALPAQNDYLPFVEDGKEWTMASLGTVSPEYQHTFSYQQIKLGSAIEVDGMTFKQIVSSSWQYDQDGPSNWKETNEYVGEADGKVYLYNQQTKNTIQVMDFTLKVGDTYRQTLTSDPNDGYEDFVVTAVKDTVIATSVDKTPRKCLYLSWSDSKETDDVWIEGIGSLYGGVQGAYGRMKPGAISMLRICKADEQTLYEAYHPFLKEGKTWNYQEYYHNLLDDEQWTKDVSYVINGTTEIDGKAYYKMYRISEEGSEYYCALREEDRKVWQYTSDDGDQLLYDFGMSVGDDYTPSDEPIRYQLTDIKPMRFQYYQLLNVLHYDVSEQYDPTEPYEYIGPEQIVEGVGCRKGWNFMELYALVPYNGILHGENFLSCYEDGKCIFTADDFNLYEMQTKEIEVINDNKAENKKGIYNLQGQRIRHLQKGLNIVNGRKVHVK
ncbi:leucine-rich repeat protein [Prevotella communis]|uniref:leucine-rich repeat domain-containing protein n=1 Tax=Prevotella communis TaxID=2913614 RepID=UPI001EDACFD2|nr:leucine-rich repeat protein [Prevotella communis]UKK70522.1 leucine-rich repeat protein [Prevotella communis]